MVSGWLERSLRAPLLEVIQQEHRRQAVQQTSLANVISSCRRLAQIQWRELFESISWAEIELATDPAGVYAARGFRDAGPLPRRGRGNCQMVKVFRAEIIDRGAGAGGRPRRTRSPTCRLPLIDEGREALSGARPAYLSGNCPPMAPCHAAGFTSEVSSCYRSPWWRPSRCHRRSAAWR